MKMLMLVFHRESEGRIMDYLGTSIPGSYSLISNVYDSGVLSVTDEWAGDGEMLLIEISENKIPAMKDKIHGLRESFKGESIRAFILPVDEVF